jgi:ABC-type transport system involved in cytochrome bd biosynthesis fused ATPase/permease subunit
LNFQDRIVVLDKGRVAEFDTPAELIKSGGKFYELAKEGLPEPLRAAWTGFNSGGLAE